VKRTVRLGLSAVMGLSAALLAWSAVAGAHAEAERASRRALERYGGDVTRVCVALREIEPGDEISEGNVKVVEWVSSLMPEDALTSMGDASGLVATARIPAHTPLAKAHFLRDERVVQVPRGTVAISVASDAEHAVGGSLARGDEVDVYVADASVADRLTRAEVLDTSVLADGGGDLSWVTLAVDASAVRDVLAATTRGEVTLVLPGASASREAARSERANNEAARPRAFARKFVCAAPTRASCASMMLMCSLSLRTDWVMAFGLRWGRVPGTLRTCCTSYVRCEAVRRGMQRPRCSHVSTGWTPDSSQSSSMPVHRRSSRRTRR